NRSNAARSAARVFAPDDDNNALVRLTLRQVDEVVTVAGQKDAAMSVRELHNRKRPTNDVLVLPDRWLRFDRQREEAELSSAAGPVAIRLNPFPPKRRWRGQRQIENRNQLSMALATA